MKVVDTNYLVRLFTNQPRHMAKQALSDLALSTPGEVLLPDFVVSELIYVLEFHDELSYSRRQIVDGVRLILSHPAWTVDEDLHSDALELYDTAKLDYVDCLVLTLYKLKRADHVLTFDKGMRKRI